MKPYRQPVSRSLSLLWLSLLLLLSACGPNEPQPKNGLARLEVSIPGYHVAARGPGRTALREGVPEEVTSLLIEVLDRKGSLLASAEVIGSDGVVTLEVVAGSEYTLRGTARAGDEVLFKGETRLKEVAAGSHTSISLSLQDQVSLSIQAPASIQAGTGGRTIDVELQGLNDTRIDWFVNGVKGGSQTLGLIDSAGVYTPPANISQDTQITLRAQPVAAPSFAQSFSFTLTPASNTAPTAVAGVDQSVFEASTVTLDGSASSDAQSGIAAYRWVQTAGPAVTLDHSDRAQVGFVAPAVNDGAVTDLQFDLTVTDDGGLSNTDSVRIRVRDLPNISITDVAQNEGDSGQNDLVFTVRLESFAGDVSLKFATVDGSASSVDDYVAASGTLHFTGGATARSVVVGIQGDTRVESDESFVLNLSELSGLAEFANSSATATIKNDDVAQVPAFDVTVQASQYDPNQLNPFTLTVSFPAPVTGFDSADILLTRATLSNLSTTDNTVYTATVQPVSHGTVTVNIPAGTVIDASGASNKAATEIRLPFFNWVFIHPSLTTSDLTALASGGGRCLMAGGGGNVTELFSSASGLDFQRVQVKPNDPDEKQINDILYSTLDGGLYLAATMPGYTNGGYYTSNDASDWSFHSLPGNFSVLAQGVGGDGQPLLLAANGDGSQVATSRDGSNWSTHDFSSALLASEFVDMNDVIWDGSRFIAVGLRFQSISFSNSNHGSIIFSSTDGENWSVIYRSSTFTGGFSNATYDFLNTVTLGEDGSGNPRWLAMGNKGVIATSGDGLNWSEAATSLGDAIRINSVQWSGNQFVAVGHDQVSSSDSRAVVFTSPDGLNWTQQSLPAAVPATGSSLSAVEACPGQGDSGQDVWLAVGRPGLVLKSGNGADWSVLNQQQFSDPITSLAEGNSLILAETRISGGHSLMRSSDGINWSAGFSEDISDLSFIDNTFYAITRDSGNGNWSFQSSSDGLSWAQQLQVSPYYPNPGGVVSINPPSGGSLWVLSLANESSIYLSADALNWSTRALGDPLQTEAAANGRGDGLIAALNDRLASSEDGIAWTNFGNSWCNSGNCPYDEVIQVIQYQGRYLVLGVDRSFGEGGEQPVILYSENNGQTWVEATLPGLALCSPPRWSREADLLALSCGRQYVSHNGVDWVELLAPFDDARLVFTNGGYRLYGSRGGYVRDKPE